MRSLAHSLLWRPLGVDYERHLRTNRRHKTRAYNRQFDTNDDRLKLTTLVVVVELCRRRLIERERTLICARSIGFLERCHSDSDARRRHTQLAIAIVVVVVFVFGTLRSLVN